MRFDDGTVTITVNGYPTPVVTWKKDGVSIDHTSGRFQVLLDGSLRIRNVSFADEGTYTPLISQMDLGVIPAETITVIVQGLPRSYVMYIRDIARWREGMNFIFEW